MSTAYPLPSTRSWAPASSQPYRRVPGQALGGWVLATVLSVTTVAFFISVYLAWTGITMSSVAGCGGGGVFDCDHVLTSKWSKWMGIPVGVGAGFLYAVALTASGILFFQPRAQVQRIASATLVSLALTAGLCALWFISLQVFVLKHLCPWCLAAHTCGLTLALIVIWFKPIGRTLPQLPTLLAVVGTGILVLGQVNADPPKTYEVQQFATQANESSATSESPASETSAELFAAPVFEPPIMETSTSEAESESAVDDAGFTSATVETHQPAQAGLPPMMIVALLFGFLGFRPGFASVHASDARELAKSSVADSREVTIGRGTRLRVSDWPLLGSSEAKYVFVEMFDYTCPHCRESHRNVVRDLKKKYGVDMAIIALPVPLNSACNPGVRSTSAEHMDACKLSELSIAVWKTDPARFEEFHDWLMSGAGSRTATEAMSYAERLVDKNRLQQLLNSSFCKAYVKKHVELYQSVGSGAIPKFLFSNTSLTGRVDSAQVISDILERQN